MAPLTTPPTPAPVTSSTSVEGKWHAFQYTGAFTAADGEEIQDALPGGVLYADPGTQVFLSAIRGDSTGPVSGTWCITGYLQPIT